MKHEIKGLKINDGQMMLNRLPTPRPVGRSNNFIGELGAIVREEINFYLPPKTHKKLPSKVAHNWLGLAVVSPASFCFVHLRQFYSLKFSHL